MNRPKIFIAALVAVMMAGCDVLPTPQPNGGNNNGGGNNTEQPGGNEGDGNIEDLTMEYVVRQRRSAKRGLSGHPQIETDITMIAPGVAWVYNWGATAPFPELMQQGNMLFLPMAWNANFGADQMRAYKAANPSAEYILAYNEPNLTDQANMTPEVAASHWGALKAVAQELGMKLISPAVNYGTLAGYSDPIKWLDEFFACEGVSLDDVAGIAVHCYMPSGESLKSFIRRFDKYGKPVYMTEFCHANNSITNNEATQQNYMSDALNYMECDDNVGGYAWFMLRGSGNWKAISLVNTSAKEPALTNLGKEYVWFSSFDKECYYPTEEAFPAAHYRSNNAEEVAEGTEWKYAPKIKASTDSTGEVMLTDFYNTEMWVEYGVEVEEAGEYELLVRYSTFMDSIYKFAIDGNEVEHTFAKCYELGGTEVWKTTRVEPLNLSKGKHTLRMSLTQGRGSFNWMCLRKVK